MKSKSLFKPLSLLIAFALILSSLTGISKVKAADVIPVTGITLNKQSDTIDIANAIKLIATVAPTNATNKEVIWETDNPAVARVTNGIVRGYAEGTTIIRAITKDQGKVAFFIITVKKPVTATPIVNVRADDDNNGIPDFIIAAAPFTIEGRISADFRALTNNILSGKVYIQDSTSGIAVNGITQSLALGAKVKITGNVIYNNGETQFLATNVETVETTVEAVKPVTMSTKESMLEKREGFLVKIQGKITKTSEGTIYVNDTTNAENEARVIVGSYFIINTTPPTTSTATTTPAALTIGDTVSVTGISTQSGTDHKIVIRNEKDINLVTAEDEDEDEDKDTNEKSVVRLNKSSIVIKAGKFEHINILTTPGNAVITSVKIKTESPIITISQDKKNKRLITVTPNKNIEKTSQKLEIEVVVDGKTYILILDVKIDSAKVKSNNKTK
ncbi:MAG: LPXTG-motif cell wall anchor domain protein [Clostridiales bacterium]|jgi:hypothetical protein|nr:LPXTG-motif cell wall anchor domain protein [Clostridiales bacterium]